MTINRLRSSVTAVRVSQINSQVKLIFILVFVVVFITLNVLILIADIYVFSYLPQQPYSLITVCRAVWICMLVYMHM